MGSAVIMDNAIGGDGFIVAVNFFCDHVGSFVALVACTNMRMTHAEGGGVISRRR